MLCRCEIATRDRSHDSRMLVYETLDRVGLASTEEIHLAGNHSHLDTEVIVTWELIIDVTRTCLHGSTRCCRSPSSPIRSSAEWGSTSCEDCTEIICESTIRQIAHWGCSTRDTTDSSDPERYESIIFACCYWSCCIICLFDSGCRCSDRTRIPE